MTIEIVTRHLRALATLSDGDAQLISNLPVHYERLDPGATIIAEGSRPIRSFFLAEGLAYSQKLTGEGFRQIPAFYVAGDVPDLLALHLERIDIGFVALTSAMVGFIQHRDLHEVCARSYSLTSALWRLTLVDGAIFREWETNLGQRPAATRLAHIFCEMFVRLESVGLTEDHSYVFPIRQQDLADATGMSSVHLNRSLNALRSEGHMSFDGQRVTILDWPALQKSADFDPSYLHLRPSRE